MLKVVLVVMRGRRRGDFADGVVDISRAYLPHLSKTQATSAAATLCLVVSTIASCTKHFVALSSELLGSLVSVAYRQA